SGYLYLNEDVRVTNAGNFERIGSHLSGFQIGGYDNIGNNRDKINPIYVIGDNYLPTSDTDATNMYGITFSRSGASGPSAFDWTANSGWGFGVITNGAGTIWLDGDEGIVEATGGYNINGTVFCDADRDISVREIDATGNVTINTGTVGSGAATLAIKTATEANTSQGSVYAQLLFKVNGAENSTGAISDNTVAAIKAIDYRSGSTSFEDAGIGFYTLDSDESVHTFRGGFSNAGGFFVADDGVVDNNTAQGEIYAVGNITSGNNLQFNNSLKFGSTVLMDTAGELKGVNTISIPDGDFVVTDGNNSPGAETNIIWRDHSADRLYLGTTTDIVEFRGDVNFQSGHELQHNGTTVLNSSRHITNVPLVNIVGGVPELRLSDDSNSYGGGSQHKIVFATTGGNVGFMGIDSTSYSTIVIANNAGHGDVTSAMSSYVADIELYPQSDVNIKSGSLEMGGTEFVDQSRNVTAGTIDASGTIKQETATGGFITLKRADTTVVSNNDIGAINFEHNDADDAGVAATLLVSGDGSGGGAKMRFYTGNPTTRAERMAIASDGAVTIQETLTILDGSTEFQISGDTSSNTYLACNGQIRIRPEGTTVNKIVLDSSYIEAPRLDIGGTTVVDSSRNIVASGYIDAGGYIEAGESTGGVALTVNDGGGNANVCFNHNDEFTRVAGSWTRIKTDVDGTTAAFEVYIHDNVAANTEYSYNAGLLAIDAKTSRIQFMGDEAEISSTGNAIFEGNVTAYGTASDIRLKSDIEVIPDALAKVQKLRGVTFNYDKDGSRSTGLIAQEVLEVLPEVVYETHEINDDESFYALRYGNTVGLLVEAIKEQQGIIEALTKRIEDLENGNDAD
ncbi:MAG: tail fiber domain-containing protein, partial [Luminiphilus sp.]